MPARPYCRRCAGHKAGVVTVPYRVDPGGEAGVDYDKWIGADFANDAHNWADWIKKVLPDGGNILFLGGPAGNSQSTTEANALMADLGPSYTLVGDSPFEVTGWDPAKTQTLLSAAIAKNPKIDVIVSDFGPRWSARCPVPRQRPEDPGTGDVRRQLAELLLEAAQAKPVQDDHRHDGQRQRPARDGLRGREGHRRQAPDAGQLPGTGVRGLGQRHADPVTCRPDLPGDVYLSAEMPGEQQAKLGK